MTDLTWKARRLLQWLWVYLLSMTGCLWWAKRQLRRNKAVAVLTFHRVLTDSERRQSNSLPGIIVRQRTFEQLVSHIVRRCEVVDLQSAETDSSDGKLRIAFTFDDGWRDNCTNVLPVVRAYQIPLTVFVCPGLAGATSPFWPEQVIALLGSGRWPTRHREIENVIERLKRCTREERQQFMAGLPQQIASGGQNDTDSTLAWEEMAEMDRAGVSFGSHTQTHQILTTVPASAARFELRESRAVIERTFGKSCTVFAYPNGDWSPETRRILSEEGFRLAFTSERGVWTAASDRLAIPRSNIYEGNLVGLRGRFWPPMFEYTTFWKAWRAMHAKSRSESMAVYRATRINAPGRDQEA